MLKQLRCASMDLCQAMVQISKSKPQDSAAMADWCLLLQENAARLWALAEAEAKLRSMAEDSIARYVQDI